MSSNLGIDALSSPLVCGEGQAAAEGDNFNKDRRADRLVN